MERVQIEESLSFSRIIHGLWRLADWKFTSKETLELIEFCLDKGITTFDHADIYGSYTCEGLFGEALRLKPSLRHEMEIVSKCGIVLPSKQRPEHQTHHYNTTKQHILTSVDHSLKSLGTDYLDTLLIHRPDPFMDPNEVAEAFVTLKEQGKVRTFGVSNFKDHQWRMLESYLPFSLVTNQIELSAYNLENVEDGTLTLCQEKRVAPMAWSPLAGGNIFTAEDDRAQRLRGTIAEIQEDMDIASMDQVLYAWLLNHPATIMPIVGSGKQDRIASAVDALDIKLNHDQWFEILHASMGHEVP